MFEKADLATCEHIFDIVYVVDIVINSCRKFVGLAILATEMSHMNTY